MAKNRTHLHVPVNAGEKIADVVTSSMGSWAFIIAQSVIVAFWMILNSVAWFWHWDPMPFIFLNLVFSTQAAYASPLILMSQNRAATRDRKRDDLEAEEVALLVTVNQQQLEILQLLQNQDTHDNQLVNRILTDLSNAIGRCQTVEDAQQLVWRLASSEEMKS